MSRTIYEIATEVCERASVQLPPSLFGTNDVTARRLRVGAKDTIRDILNGAMQSGVSLFNAQWVFATKPGVHSYTLPPDWLRPLPDSIMEDDGLCAVGPVSVETWNHWLTGRIATATRLSWRQRNGMRQVQPVPTEAQIVIYDYVSNYPVVRDATDADLELRDGVLQPVAPLVARDGVLSDGVLAGGPTWGEAHWGLAIWGQSNSLDYSRVPPTQTGIGYPNFQVRAPEFTADTDKCGLHDDYILSLGMTYRLRRAAGLEYADEQAEYIRHRDTFLAMDASSGEDIHLSRFRGRMTKVPLGNGKWSIAWE